MPAEDTPPFITQPIADQSWENFAAVLEFAEHARLAGDVKRAHVFFERLVELDPDDPRGWIGLAETTQDLDEKIVRWGYLSAIKSDDVQSRAQLDTCIDEKLARANETDVTTLLSLAHRIAEMGLRAPAYRLFTRATELDPSNVEGWLGRASVASQTRQVIYCLQQALSLDSSNAQAKADLDAALQKQKLPRPTNSQSVGDAHLAFERGQSVFQAGAIEQAYEHFKEATELDPNDPTAWFWRSGTSPTIAEALMCIERVLEIDPTNQSAKEARWWLRFKKYCADVPAIHSVLYVPVNEPLVQTVETPPWRRINSIVLVSFILIVLIIILATQIIFKP